MFIYENYKKKLPKNKKKKFNRETKYIYGNICKQMFKMQKIFEENIFSLFLSHIDIYKKLKNFNIYNDSSLKTFMCSAKVYLM